ncbi:uncharacterized protein LOC133846932 [Drosophila sulfurigaster albostrigata]|uniref:uncharacterized protein LOC133846932 n=1 Tax=Drosophila sulfurigaster albostrigata TaxID=89887 RepID=UPI002D21A396|nr:uncharacterized protein LOC133846932 [Drosophila sulfurigaster albostrigata]
MRRSQKAFKTCPPMTSSTKTRGSVFSTLRTASTTCLLVILRRRKRARAFMTRFVASVIPSHCRSPKILFRADMYARTRSPYGKPLSVLPLSEVLILYLLLLARHSGFWSGLASERVCPSFIAFAQVFPGRNYDQVAGSSSRSACSHAGLRCHLFHFRGWTLVALRWDFNLIN